MNRTLKLSLSICLLIPVISAEAKAEELPECVQGRSKECHESGNFGVYYDCLSEKQQLLSNCVSSMNKNLSNGQQQIFSQLEESARADGNKLDETTNELQSHLSEIEKINKENDQRFQRIRKRFIKFASEFEKTTKPFLRSLPAVYLKYSKDINSIVEENTYENRPNLQEIDVDLQSNYLAHMTRLMAIRSEIILVKAELDFFSEDYRLRTSPHKEYLARKGYNGLLFDTRDLLALANKADESISLSMKEINDSQKTLTDRIQIATNSLIEQFILNKSKKIIDDTNHMLSATRFLEQVNTSIKKAFVTSTEQIEGGLPKFGKKYLAINEFIQFASICEAAVKSSWMTTGCTFAVEKLAAARTVIKKMPSNIQMGLNLISAEAPTRKASVEQIKNLLKEKKLQEATLAYDQLVKETFQ